MKNNSQTYMDWTTCYQQYFPVVLNFITFKIGDRENAKDLTQDVFVRLFDYKQMVRPETVKFFIYKISRNLVIDYLRRQYKKQEIDFYLATTASTMTNETEEKILSDEIFLLERKKLSLFPKQRRVIYALSRYQEKTVPEISVQMNLSKRTIENHLMIGRRVMREYLRKSI